MSSPSRRRLIAALPALVAAFAVVPYSRLLPRPAEVETSFRVWADGVLLREGDGYVRDPGMFTVLPPARRIRMEVGDFNMEYSSSAPVAGFRGFEISGFNPDDQT